LHTKTDNSKEAPEADNGVTVVKEVVSGLAEEAGVDPAPGDTKEDIGVMALEIWPTSGIPLINANKSKVLTLITARKEKTSINRII
jgi:hypothetical protein